MKKLITSQIAVLISLVLLCAMSLTAQNAARTNDVPGDVRAPAKRESAPRGTHSLDSTDSYIGSQRALLIVLVVVRVK